MTNAALDRLERLSSIPPTPYPERPGDDATYEERYKFLIQYGMAVSDDRIEERQFRQDVIVILRELVELRDLLRDLLHKGGE